jgi:hypothetical protein
MVSKQNRSLMALGLAVVLLTAGAGRAGPYIGDWGYCWKPAPGCPCGDYCFLHYLTPTLYRAIYCAHPANLNQFPPGAPVPVGFTLYPRPCRSTGPSPTRPYADPSGFYGRPLVPPEGEARDEKDKK